MTRHLISTRARLVRCGECSRVIWFAYDGGVPVYCDTDELTLYSELEARLMGRRTFNYRPAIGLWYRNEWSLADGCAVFAEHKHSSGYVELEARCPTETKKKATDSSAPPF